LPQKVFKAICGTQEYDPEQSTRGHALSDIQHKVEGAYLDSVHLADGEQQLGTENRIGGVASFVREKELRGEFRLIWGLDFDVNMPRAPGI